MKKTVLIAAAAAGFWAKAQTHRFVYDVMYKKDAASEVVTKENYHLDIHPDRSEYYQRDFFIADSLITNNIPFPKDSKLNTSTIVSHKKGEELYDEYDLLENTVLKLQSKDTQTWQLTNENKKVKDLTLQKATTHYGGRNWTAWFSKEIPFQDGPYKFHGLPGLIVELYDDKSNYKFELVKSVKLDQAVNNMFIKMSKEMSVPVTLEKYKSTKLAYYDSPVNFIRNGQEGDQFFLNDGTKVNASNRREINDRMRENIKKYNNPINLDTKINYQ
ncbi:GLPGLI family protein [Chryseobacterium arthrosphaerae]|uniref:GLPGLI family protein n=1 Tax=Chryseobacterium arthrosphaerae TaxID=651561 RepID=UPI00241E5559|nr:GLPGLI family protein [Chryseobacterium arthrosphaerae]